MEREHFLRKSNLKIMVSILALALAGCQSGGGTEPAQSAAEQVDDGLCHGPDGAVDCHGATCVNGECLECLNNTQCEDPNKPACHAHKCEPCSGANDCSVGSCDTKSGQCVECLADDDCESVSSDGHVTNSNVWGHIDHSFGTAPRTMCVEHQCVACNVSTCMGTCIDGRCNARKTTNCEGNACEFSPTTIGDIAPETRGLADAVRLFRLAVPNVSAQETAPTVEAYSVDAWVNGMVATVTTEFVIFNPNARAMEGTLEFPLPDDAVVSGYAIDVDGMMMDAQVVDKQNARMAYENEVKKGVDPGLVEQMKGNAYRTRIYPIPAQGGRRVRVEYTTPLMVAPNGDAALALPMPNTELKQRDIKISVVAQGVPAPAVGGLGDTRFAKAQAVWVVDSHETDVKPRENVLVAMPSLPDTVVSTETFRGDRFFMASMKVSNDAVKKELPPKYRVIWDASGSRSKEDIDKARAFIEHLPENGTYELHVFRNVLEPAKTLTGRAKLLAALDRIVYDGGTDFSPLEKIASKKFEGMTLFFTDGMDTFTGALPEFGTNSIAVMSGAARDVSSMRKICRGRTINLDAVNGDEAVRQILNAPLMASEVTGSGLSHIEGLGKPVVGRVTLVGRIEPGTTEATVVMSNGDKIAIQFPSEPPAEGKAIAKSWAARRIDDLSPRAEDNRDELLALGRMFSIVSPVSSMIVFENLSQWLEYDIEPPENSPLHDKWLAQRKSNAERASEKNAEEEVWQENFDDLWDLRLTWYNEPKSKVKYKKPVKKKPRRNLDDDDDWDDDDDDDDDDEENDSFARFALYRSHERLSNYCVPPRPPRRVDYHNYNTATPSAPYPSAPNIRFMDGGYSGHSEESASRPAVQYERSVSESSGGEDRSLGYSGGYFNPEPGEFYQSQSASRDEEGNVEAEYDIEDWDPDMPYLTAIKDAQKVYKSSDALYKEYIKQREEYAYNPAFYLDCANLFFKEKKKELAIRILSNLAELQYDDVDLLRVYAWRLREAGEYDGAIVILRKVAQMRSDEAISWRDLAVTLTMRAKKNKSVQDAQEALELFHKTAFTAWDALGYRDDSVSIAIVALEEFNELVAWCKRQGWVDGKLTIPKTDPKYLKNFESDLRIVVTWDADDTDIDLQIVEPTGEEVYFGHKCSLSGGILSYDITSGYGPEEFTHKYAPKGKYVVYTNYFASHEAGLIGAATITVTFYSNWGRASQKSQTVTYRLEEEKDKIKVGEYILK